MCNNSGAPLNKQAVNYCNDNMLWKGIALVAIHYDDEFPTVCHWSSAPLA